MNRQEHRTLRAIEKNLTDDDPMLAELLGSSGSSRAGRLPWFVAWLAGPFVLLGFVPGEVIPLLAGVFLAVGAFRHGRLPAARGDEPE